MHGHGVRLIGNVVFDGPPDIGALGLATGGDPGGTGGRGFPVKAAVPGRSRGFPGCSCVADEHLDLLPALPGVAEGDADLPIGVCESERCAAIGAQLFDPIHLEQRIQVEHQYVHRVYHAGPDFERPGDPLGFGENLYAEPVVRHIVGGLFGLQGPARIIGGHLGLGKHHKAQCRQQERYPVLHREKIITV